MLHSLSFGVVWIIPAYAGSTLATTPPSVPSSGSSPHTRGARHVGSHGIFELQDHPRIRGEHDDHVHRGLLRAGIIPAYAGSTTPSSTPWPASGDHPRIRGEHSGVNVALAVTSGSSPHTRGARGVDAGGVPREGIIPAYAGSTQTRPATTAAIADHPRIRGEHRLRGERPRDRHGSSPHTRGARRHGRDGRGLGGIIPAYAGSTTRSGCWPPRLGDHPRIRGEHLGAVPLALPLAGIIPAYAGSTHAICADKRLNVGSSPHTRGARSSRSSRSTCRGDHPRIRGEHDAEAVVVGDGGGIIPAYAGSTAGSTPCGTTQRGSSPHTRGAHAWYRAPRVPGRDHPRIRGEHYVVARLPGTLSWIIPAYAGSTSRLKKLLATLAGSSPHTRGALVADGWSLTQTEDHPRIRGEHQILSYTAGK